MGKLLFVAFLGVVVWLVLRSLRARTAASDRCPSEPAAQAMVTCAHCGVHQPVSESLLSDGHYYCCDQHRERGPVTTRRH